MTRFGQPGDPLHWVPEVLGPQDAPAPTVRGDAGMGVVRRPGGASLVSYSPLRTPQLLPQDATAVQEVYWYKAQAVWQDNGGDPRVSCKLCADRAGTGETGDAAWVWLPHRSGEDPNVRADEVIPVFLMPDDTLVCALDTSDGRVGYSIRIWQGTNIPAGWETLGEAAEAFLKVDTAGATGGSATHTHTAHPAHDHEGLTGYPDLPLTEVDAPEDPWAGVGSSVHRHVIPEEAALSHEEASSNPLWYGINLIKRTS